MKILGKAYKEIYRIIEHSEKEIQDKMPRKFMNVIETAMSKEYEPNIDYSISINEQKLMPETFAIMAIIYRDFICSKEEKNILLEKENKELKKIEQEKIDLYNPDNIFKNRNRRENSNEKDDVDCTNMVKYKESILKRIINKLKHLFNIKK